MALSSCALALCAASASLPLRSLLDSRGRIRFRGRGSFPLGFSSTSLHVAPHHERASTSNGASQLKTATDRPWHMKPAEIASPHNVLPN
ncbi:uncharacterized protein CC84DRAFT_1161720 [Paraphaeosphaeria sporulosa]|uniref:Uncharacterized protein n=1 Tax=Paraphaeosphaeria sporulosa TaxID=1460663 RepID=A0A177CV59_9PLEO|nr:uncharacterized protein CC84DRAFT_1161720 [Paraphaeosphaeria sporulosa]OAG10898.1 hypothetical protein CC84DRAFT_1161720 [Paraphaeosphaeria sporulosa]